MGEKQYMGRLRKVWPVGVDMSAEMAIVALKEDGYRYVPTAIALGRNIRKSGHFKVVGKVKDGRSLVNVYKRCV